jgi:hypothetical protein
MTQLAQAISAQLHALITTGRYRLQARHHDERGSVTIQEVLWAIAALGFVALVVAAINAYLNNKISLIK